jgi:membrane-bound lytic murein transglycosylase D
MMPYHSRFNRAGVRALLVPLLAGILSGTITRTCRGAASNDSTFGGHPDVARYLRYFAHGGREQMNRGLERGAPYLPLIRQRLSSLDLPEDFSLLPLIESGYRSSAVSKAGAVGMWQFMPETARRYGLRVDALVDERRDPIKATDAAVHHLRDLVDRFGSTALAAAAYNAGAGSIERGLGRVAGSVSPGSTGEGTPDATFFRLSDASLLAHETAEYVPQLLAASIIARDPERFGFDPAPWIGPAVAFDSVIVDKPIRLSTAARVAGVPEKIVREMNLQYVRGITPALASSTIRFPFGSIGGNLAGELARLPAEEISSAGRLTGLTGSGSGRRKPPPPPRHVLVRRGDTAGEIARRFGITESSLRRLNALGRRASVRPGQILALPGIVPAAETG